MTDVIFGIPHCITLTAANIFFLGHAEHEGKKSSYGGPCSKGVNIDGGKHSLSPCDTLDMAISRPDHDSSFKTSDSDTASIPHGAPAGKGLPCDAMIDTPDYNPDSLTFSIFDCVIYLMSIGTYMADVGSDLWVAAVYYKREHWWWCGLTLSFVFVPSLAHCRTPSQRTSSKLPPCPECCC